MKHILTKSTQDNVWIISAEWFDAQQYKIKNHFLKNASGQKSVNFSSCKGNSQNRSTMFDFLLNYAGGYKFQPKQEH